MPYSFEETQQKINESLQEGHTPGEIIDFMKQKPEYAQKIADSFKAGYTPQQIIDHFRGGQQTEQAQVSTIPQNAASGQPGASGEDMPISAKRASMGLPIFYGQGPKAGQKIDEIRPSEETLVHSDEIMRKAQQHTYSTPDPSLLQNPFKNPLGIANLATGLPQLARSAEEVGKSGKLITPGLGANIFGALPAGKQTMMLGKAAKFTGLQFLGKAAAKLPVVKPALEKVASTVQSWLKVPALATNILGRMAEHVADTHAAYQEVSKLGDELATKHNLSSDELKNVFNAHEAYRITEDAGKKAESLLTEKEHALLDDLRPIQKSLSDLAVKEGVVEKANEGYFTHLYFGNKSKSFFSSIMKTAPIAKKRTWDTAAELATQQNKLTQELEAKGVTVEEALKKSDSELKDLGFDPRIKGTLSLRPMMNPIKSLQAQLLATRMAIATKKNVLSLADMTTETGEKLIDNSYAPNRVKLNSNTFNTWVAKSIKTGDKTLTRFFEKDAYVLKKHSNDVNRLLNSNSYPDWIKGVKEINRVTKFARFFNPAIHNVNESFSALQNFGFDFQKVLGLPGKAIASNQERMSEAIADGFESQHLYGLKNTLAKDFDVIMGKYRLPYITDAMDAVQQKFTDPYLWNHVEHIGLTVWDTAKRKFIANGMPEKEAGQAAVTLAHDVIGKMTKATTMKAFQNPVMNAFVNFIPSWINTSFRKYIGAFLPDQAFMHLPEITRKALQAEYKHNLLSGITMGHMISQRLNFALSGHTTFENLPENRPSVAHPFGKIEMNLGNKLYTVDFPIMGSLTLPPRFIAGIANVFRGKPQSLLANLQPITSAPLSAALESYKTGRVGPGLMKGAEQLAPIRTFTDPKQTAGEATLNSVLPFRLQQADPRSDVVKKLWTAYKNDNKFEIIGQQEPWKDELDRAIQGKAWDKARQLMQLHYTGRDGHRFFEHRKMKFEKPNTYTYLLIPKEKRNKYLQQLTPDEMNRLRDKINTEAAQDSTP